MHWCLIADRRRSLDLYQQILLHKLLARDSPFVRCNQLHLSLLVAQAAPFVATTSPETLAKRWQHVPDLFQEDIIPDGLANGLALPAACIAFVIAPRRRLGPSYPHLVPRQSLCPARDGDQDIAHLSQPHAVRHLDHLDLGANLAPIAKLVDGRAVDLHASPARADTGVRVVHRPPRTRRRHRQINQRTHTGVTVAGEPQPNLELH